MIEVPVFRFDERASDQKPQRPAPGSVCLAAQIRLRDIDDLACVRVTDAKFQILPHNAYLSVKSQESYVGTEIARRVGVAAVALSQPMGRDHGMSGRADVHDLEQRPDRDSSSRPSALTR